MRKPTKEDFDALAQWPHLSNDPLATLQDYSSLKEELRWLNPRHRDAHLQYYLDRYEWTGNNSFRKYYETTDKTFFFEGWKYIKDRKAWYICPFHWEKFSTPNVTRVLDLGCGDGDVTQNVADFIAKCWKKDGYSGHEVEILGIDLSPSRIQNAQNFCSSPHEKIELKFKTGDAAREALNYPDQSFDYALSTGVFEILEDHDADESMDNLTRLTKCGVYFEDIADQYPGGFPRDLEPMVNKYGFQVVDKACVFKEPFTLENTLDPLELWPILKIQLVFAERIT